MKKKVAIGLLGTVLDAAKKRNRWEKWRPTVSLFQQSDISFDRIDLLFQERYARAGRKVLADIQELSPQTDAAEHLIMLNDPWDFEEVFAELLSFANAYPFDLEKEDYFIHITTGTHVAQICLFLLTEARYLPGKLIQTSPPPKECKEEGGSYTVIDLDLSRYDQIASRFQQEQLESQAFLKSGINTRNSHFNHLIEEIETVAMRSTDPILLMGPTGAGKSQLARRIYDLKKMKRQTSGSFIDINCATLRGDGAMSALFGHVRGSFTGASHDRTGLLREAHKGVLFLDEIGELGLDEQAMLLNALEEKAFRPVGSNQETHSDFQLIAGTNRNLWSAVHKGAFREDLLARINTWSFELPALKDRKEDLEPNLYYELDQFSRKHGHKLSFNKEALGRFLDFALGPDGLWASNFRDLNAAVIRMGTLSNGGRINQEDVIKETMRLKKQWHNPQASHSELDPYFSPEEREKIDLFDQAQLAQVLAVCKECATLSEAGRRLFAASRQRKRTQNDSDRLAKYLDKFKLKGSQVLRK